MKKNIEVKKKYSLKHQNQKDEYIFHSKYTGENITQDIIQDLGSLNIIAALNSDVDIFTKLPDDIYKNKDASLFLEALRQAIAKENLENITLAKLIVSEQTDTGCTLDWIYNHFRLYFTFDKIDGDYLGLIFHNSEEGFFTNNFRKINPTDFKKLAQTTLDQVISMIQGDISQ